MSAVNTKHPEYEAMLETWELMNDTYQGQQAVKDAGTKYLPATSGQREDGMNAGQEGRAAYDSYKLRALFYEYVSDAVKNLLGVMHRKMPTIEVPERMEPLLENLTSEGESAWTLLRRINLAQLLLGRYAMLVDMSAEESTEAMPYIAPYTAKALINWDSTTQKGRETLSLAVLDESGFERRGFGWAKVDSYRELAMEEGRYVQRLHLGTEAGAAEDRTPVISGQALTEIPLVIVNTNDLVSSVSQPPLVGLANLAIAIYQADADYRNARHLHGHPTLVRKGYQKSDEGENQTLGGVVDVDENGDLRYVETNGQGLSEMREALDRDKERAGQLGAQLLTGAHAGESGDALARRQDAATATLGSIAESGAEALGHALKLCARFMGLSEEEVRVEPNTDFADDRVPAADVAQLWSMVIQGGPLSRRSFHDWLRANEYTTLSYEEELEQQGEEGAEAGFDGAASRDIDPDEDDIGELVRRTLEGVSDAA